MPKGSRAALQGRLQRENQIGEKKAHCPVLWDPMALERGLQGLRTPTLPKVLTWSQVHGTLEMPLLWSIEHGPSPSLWEELFWPREQQQAEVKVIVLPWRCEEMGYGSHNRHLQGFKQRRQKPQ
ncbi:hypothetical protein ACRRTK_009686 [Alexandromys fortis]